MKYKHKATIYDGLGEALYILSELQLLIKRMRRDEN